MKKKPEQQNEKKPEKEMEPNLDQVSGGANQPFLPGQGIG